MTIEQVCDAVQGYMAEVSGVKRAPSKPREQESEYPFTTCYPRTGRLVLESDRVKGLHDIVVELHVKRRDLASTVDTALPFVESIPAKLFAKLRSGKWDGLIDTFAEIGYEFLPMAWGTDETLGWRFTVRGVKIHTAAT